MRKLLASGLATALLLLAATPAARAEDGRHRNFLLGAGAGVLGTVLLGSLFGSHGSPPVPAPVPAYALPPAPYALPVVYSYPPPVYYAAPPSRPRVYYYIPAH
jgi:hypothetical protein